MQKKSLELSCYIAGSGAFGVFFRWLQNMLAFDEEGLNEKSAFNILVPLLIIAAFAMFRRFEDRIRKQRYYVSEDFCEALFNPGRLFALARWAAGLMMIAGAGILIITTETDPNAELIKILAMLAALSGLAFPLVLGSANYDEFANVPFVRLGMLLPVFMYGFWLVLSYKQNAYNSVAWSYAIEMLAIIVNMLAFFRVAGFSFYVVNARKCIVSVMMSGALSIMVLADSRYMGMQIIFLSSALMMVIYNWVLTMNLKKTRRSADEENDIRDDGFERVR